MPTLVTTVRSDDSHAVALLDNVNIHFRIIKNVLHQYSLQRNATISNMMSEQMQTMNIDETPPDETTHLEGKMFDFFKLPRELRDKMYDEAGSFHVIKRGGYGYEKLRLSLERWPAVNLLLVNHQFRDELIERAQKFRGLCISGTIRDCLDDDLSSILPPVHRADIIIRFPFAGSGYTINMLQQGYVSRLLQRAVERVLHRLFEIFALQEVFITANSDSAYTKEFTQALIAECETAFTILSKDDRVKTISVAHDGTRHQVAAKLRSESTPTSDEHTPRPGTGR